MKFSCEKYLLQSACGIASRAAAGKSPIPALEGLLLQASDRLTVTGYDLKKGIYTQLEAEVKEQGSVVVGARLFGEMIRRLPDGIVTISTDINNNVNVKCGKSEFNFMGISPEDYPEMPVVDGVNNIALPQKILGSMINQTIFAVADNDMRPIYTGTLFDIEGEELTLVAVDGYRLAKRSEKLESARMENCSFVVPGSALADMAKAVLHDERRVLPASILLDGEYGNAGMHNGVPCVIGRHGIEQIIQLPLTDEEQAAFDRSCATMSDYIDRAAQVQ